MASFTDAKGTAWNIRIDVNTLRRVRDATQVDLMRILEPEFLTELGGDPITLVSVLWAIVEPQANSAHISPETFGESLTGDAIDEAASALIEGIADFFPSSRAKILRKIKAKADQMIDEATAKILTELDKPAKNHQTAQESGKQSTTMPQL